MRNGAVPRVTGSTLAIIALAGLAVGLDSADRFSIAWAGYVIVGWYLVLRRPANRMGWLLLIVGFCFGGAIGLMPVAEATESIWIEIVSSQISIVGFAAMAMVPILFPTGHASDRWGRWMAMGLVAIALLTVASEVFGSDPKPSGRMSPLAVPALRDAADFLQGEGFTSVPLVLLGALAGLLVRWRRSTGVERLQYRWFLSALGVVIGALVSVVAVQSMPEWTVVLALLSLNLLPVAIGIAVLRYRLYEIDRIVSRTVTYALAALLVAGVYATPVVTLPRLLGESNDLIVAGSTLDARRRRRLRPGQTARATPGRQTFQPRPLRRGPDRGPVRRAPSLGDRPGGDRRPPRRTDRRDDRTGGQFTLDQGETRMNWRLGPGLIVSATTKGLIFAVASRPLGLQLSDFLAARR